RQSFHRRDLALHAGHGDGTLPGNGFELSIAVVAGGDLCRGVRSHCPAGHRTLLSPSPAAGCAIRKSARVGHRRVDDRRAVALFLAGAGTSLRLDARALSAVDDYPHIPRYSAIAPAPFSFRLLSDERDPVVCAEQLLHLPAPHSADEEAAWPIRAAGGTGHV